MDNILSDWICQKYGICRSELISFGTEPIYLEVRLDNGHIFNIKLSTFNPNDVDGIYKSVEDTLDNYYLMKDRKKKLKQLKYIK